jgi:DNA mismatch repair ATPase MutS
MQQERIWTLIARKLSGDASPEDLTELDQMVKDIPELGTYLNTLEQDDTEKVETAYQQMTDALDKQNHLFFIRITQEEEEAGGNEQQQAAPHQKSSFAKLLHDIKKKLQKSWS